MQGRARGRNQGRTERPVDGKGTGGDSSAAEAWQRGPHGKWHLGED